jgi:hypothetical protein
MLPQKRPTTSLPLLAASNAAARQHGLHLPGAKATTIDRWAMGMDAWMPRLHAGAALVCCPRTR